ncbi:undecaprenyldiphospho-muramoylpentapeptide beta-N-acetylglucosaminyltransferase [Erythrobacter litoralis]|uniref:UDP-N-acetylglucosamine--N-acetylmuramyl-(pentapeptide) pyrophosphoryl-undecaprenol N-acetylglucosamine transferase n=1 Tax=Erythrobacter litoralis (strain HTCC2594) TaxID=314225 RepID=MURG_ERYLH|nr:undecaprenyldiphospho-muramoylpentapeptide beta-N-acetylglucosaminyltransferase [Erythrobacter litoralis]Q2NCZ0.1 RecName: Full=UDP-N-acetylglucosamine--N-acetylmuramyl-(pentapeptide) pyrophosphoryl-undecaprenol N-acetylglucosamine transferase; AltName: Full=Undecaprenyl-PP-MurNAc-pentapeptide-UDPGlcNAc GlcNAc transferase [Erythrobacter litoralis HTCC2594]ABC62451.1 UDP-N-acetylglucosamine:LPS N-acetylglucosamine transferase [Erythrobacter litoralis HTCC2594]
MTGANRHYVLAAGGTGGHLLPAFALAAELDRRGHHVALITDERGAKIPGKPDFLPAHVIPAGRFGKNPLRWVGGLRAVWKGREMAKRLFESFQPSAVVGFGGYPALPAMLAASREDIPSIIHEQNAVLGRVNRLQAGRVSAIATAYPEIQRLKPKHAEKIHLVGNPVRAGVLSLRDEPFPPFTEDGLLKVLVTGGSQGASVLSQIVPDGLAMLPPALRQRLQVTQQCRPEDLDTVRERYKTHDIPAELGSYFEDMAARLADAHLFIGRAGASTIAELTAVGRPAILVPLPIATDDHQAHNTREVVKAGGARMIRQEKFTPKELAKQIQALGQRPDTLATAAHAAWNCGRPKAVEDLADLVESFGGADMMDVIKVGGNNARAASQGVAVGQGAAKERAE